MSRTKGRLPWTLEEGEEGPGWELCTPGTPPAPYTPQRPPGRGSALQLASERRPAEWVAQGRGGISCLTEGGSRQCLRRDEPGRRRQEQQPGAFTRTSALWP